MAKTPKPRPLFTVRTAVVLLIAVLLAVVGGALMLAGAGINPALAVLAAVSGSLAVTRWAHLLIE